MADTDPLTDTDKPNSRRNVRLRVLKAHHHRGRTYYKEVGMCLVSPDISDGVLYLYWMEGDFLLRPPFDDDPFAAR